MSFLNAQTP
jgi:hypothetical protein